MQTLDIFTGKPREDVFMTVCDAGVGNGSEIMAMFKCDICGDESEWLAFETNDDLGESLTLSAEEEIKRGIPCQKCNQTQCEV